MKKIILSAAVLLFVSNSFGQVKLNYTTSPNLKGQPQFVVLATFPGQKAMPVPVPNTKGSGTFVIPGKGTTCTITTQSGAGKCKELTVKSGETIMFNDGAIKGVVCITK